MNHVAATSSARPQLGQLAPEPFELDLFRATIGPGNQSRYIYIFENFAHGAGPISWHWPAFFFTFFWLIYRKQWLYALLYVMLSDSVFDRFYDLAWTDFEQATGKVAAALLLFMVPSMFADRLYYRTCKKRIAKVRAKGGTREWQLRLLARTGGTSRVVTTAMGVLVLAAVTIAIEPAFHNYRQRSLTDAAYAHAKGASVAVETYHVRHGRLPAMLADTGYNRPAPRGSGPLTVKDGVVTIAPLGGDGRLILTPTVADGGRFTWQCKASGMDEADIPRGCH